MFDNKNLKSALFTNLKGLCHGSPVHFALFLKLLALNHYGT